MIAPSQGAHLVLDRVFLPGETAIMIPRTDDGRVLFAIPWHGRTLVGTTDTSMATLPTRSAAAGCGDRLPAGPRGAVPAEGLRPGPTSRACFAGLRPLIRPEGAGARRPRSSRESTPSSSRAPGWSRSPAASGRPIARMARDAVDHAARVAQLPSRPCVTASLKLHGWQQPGEAAASSLDVYGSDLPDLKTLAAERPDWGTPAPPLSPYLAAEVVWAVRHEAARSVSDVLCRRTRALFLDARASLESGAQRRRAHGRGARTRRVLAVRSGCPVQTLAEGFMTGPA